jgi:hypothetical protein
VANEQTLLSHWGPVEHVALSAKVPAGTTQANVVCPSTAPASEQAVGAAQSASAQHVSSQWPPAHTPERQSVGKVHDVPGGAADATPLGRESLAASTQ